ncbi:MAG: class I SAM-dependent methyltransferase [Desulfobacteraceae bacterium]|jgi:ubiquinone/menaquinone biosynthesis C-methylase UbiE
MNTIKKVFNSDHANKYDQKTKDLKYLDPQIIFGLTCRYINPGETILDIGIGTGLSSELFFRAGLKVYGLDFSPEMLACCAAKNMTADLKEHDLHNTPYPFDTDSINHAVCAGVTHMFEDINPILGEVSRIIRPNGFFSFVVPHCRNGENRVKHLSPPNAQSEKIPIYSYSGSTIQALLKEHVFYPVHELLFESSSVAHQHAQYKAYVIQNKKDGGNSL